MSPFSFVVVAYVAICILTGIYGSWRRLGFFGTTAVAFIITPVLVLLILVLTAPRADPPEDDVYLSMPLESPPDLEGRVIALEGRTPPQRSKGRLVRTSYRRAQGSSSAA
jgi:hypothetical protein